MHIQSHKLWSGRLFALAPMALAASGCFNAVVGDAEICFDDGDGGYAVGEKYQRGCETCVCKADGSSECTGSCGDYDGAVISDAALGDAGTRACFVDGNVYPPGNFIPQGYDCTCSCSSAGKVDCEPSCVITEWGDAGWDPYLDGGYSDGGKDFPPSYDGGRPPWLDASVDGGPAYYDAGLPLDAGWHACVYN